MTVELRIKDVAFNFQKHGHNLASALVYAEVGKALQSDPAIWTGMGAALAREEVWTWSARSLMRGLKLGAGTPFESPCKNWLGIIQENMSLDGMAPVEPEEMDSLLGEIDHDPQALIAAMATLPEDDQVKAVEAFAESYNQRFLPVVLQGVRGAYGKWGRREALRYLPKFGDSPETRDALAALAVEADAKKFQPMLGKAMNAIDPEWAAQFGEI